MSDSQPYGGRTWTADAAAVGVSDVALHVPDAGRITDFSTSPKVTIVIAAYNAEKFIRQTLESAFAQSLNDIEVIVVDDGSTDGTQSILSSFSNCRLKVLRQANGGVSAARNAGLAATRAPYVFFLDADDLLLRDSLSRMVTALEQAPQRIACFAHHIRIAEDGSALSTPANLRWKMFPAADTLRHLIAKNFIACGAICIRTEAARAVGGFDPTLKLGEDWEFWCRLAVLGDFVAPCPTVSLFCIDSALAARTIAFDNRYCVRISRRSTRCFRIPAIRRKFSTAELKRRRRLAEIDAFWAGARNEYVRDRTCRFLKHIVVGALYYPDSILRPRLVYLFLRGLPQHLRRPLPGRAGS